MSQVLNISSCLFNIEDSESGDTTGPSLVRQQNEKQNKPILKVTSVGTTRGRGIIRVVVVVLVVATFF